MHRKSASQQLPQVKLNLDLVGLQDGGFENRQVVFGDDNAGQADRAEPLEPSGLNIDRSAAEFLQVCFGDRRDDEKADRIKNRPHKNQPGQNGLDIQQGPMVGKESQKPDF